MTGIRTYFGILAMLLFGACAPQQKAATTAPSTNHIVVNGKLWSSLFQQKAAEYDALCYQAYNIAGLRIDEALKTAGSKPLALITDIDETLLDNSPYAAHRALKGQDYSPETWYEWTSKAAATAMPGSLDFFRDAASRGVTVFYITNRDEKERRSTLENLKKLGFPFADDTHLILRQSESSKESRRQAVASSYEIVLLLGDNLSDFSTLWDKKSVADRTTNAADQAALFGKKFIVLPNCSYGGWEDAIYGNSYRLSPAQKDSAVKANIRAY